MKKTIVVGITGSIAAYKALSIVKNLKERGNVVYVIMTRGASSLVDEKEFAKVSGNPVQSHVFHPDTDFHSYLAHDKPMKHISLADEADLILVCPATANILAKVTYGLADDLLATTILATNAPVVFAPAMNVKMWKNRATQDNVKKLKELGYYFIDPEYGDLACGYKGVGRLADGEKILEVVDDLLNRGSQLEGKKVVVTAGATAEKLDAVRVITNNASGKMGAALSDEAFLRGAKVILIRGKNAVSPQYFVEEVVVETAREMAKALEEEAIDADIVFHTAAISDFVAKEKVNKKVKSATDWVLALEPNIKIIDRLKKINPQMFLVGFKAEYDVSEGELIKSAKAVLKRAGTDLIVANDVGKIGRGFASDTNEVWIIKKKGKVIHLPLAPKKKIAQQLMDYIFSNYLNH